MSNGDRFAMALELSLLCGLHVGCVETEAHAIFFPLDRAIGIGDGYVID